MVCHSMIYIYIYKKSINSLSYFNEHNVGIVCCHVVFWMSNEEVRSVELFSALVHAE